MTDKKLPWAGTVKLFEEVDTTTIQEQSLINFAGQLGYEPVYSFFYNAELDSHEERLVRFKQPRFACVGEEYLSVKTMLRAHNVAAESVFDYLKTLSDYEFFSDFLSRPYGAGRSMMEILAAGGCKIVQKVKGQYSRKGGFQIQNHMVKFMTPQDKAQYGKDM